MPDLLHIRYELYGRLKVEKRMEQVEVKTTTDGCVKHVVLADQKMLAQTPLPGRVRLENGHGSGARA